VEVWRAGKIIFYASEEIAVGVENLFSYFFIVTSRSELLKFIAKK
jgi:hypothetical protein